MHACLPDVKCLLITLIWMKCIMWNTAVSIIPIGLRYFGLYTYPKISEFASRQNSIHCKYNKDNNNNNRLIIIILLFTLLFVYSNICETLFNRASLCSPFDHRLCRKCKTIICDLCTLHTVCHNLGLFPCPVSPFSCQLCPSLYTTSSSDSLMITHSSMTFTYCTLEENWRIDWGEMACKVQNDDIIMI